MATVLISITSQDEARDKTNYKCSLKSQIRKDMEAGTHLIEKAVPGEYNQASVLFEVQAAGHFHCMIGPLGDQHLVGHLRLSQHCGHLLAVRLQGSARARVGIDEQQELLAVVNVGFGCSWGVHV